MSHSANAFSSRLFFFMFNGSITLCSPTGEVLEVIAPDEVPVDIRVKLMVCFIHQHVYKPLDVSSQTVPLFHNAHSFLFLYGEFIGSLESVLFS